MTQWFAAVSWLALVAWAPWVAAQAYPERPIKLIVPYGAGSSSDTLARQLSEKLAELLGQPVVVDDKPGGGAIIGTEAVAKAAPDGYTLLLGTGGTHAINKHLFKSLPYDPVASFTPVARIASQANVLVVNASSEVRTLADLIALAKAKPGKLSYGSIGIGSTVHLAGELLNTEAGIKVVHVPYKASAQAITDLLSGELTFMFYPYGALAPHIQAGRLRVLATTGPQRASYLPQAPTLAESGMPGGVLTVWLAIYGPANMSPRIVSVLYDAIAKALADPELVKKMAAVGSDAYLAGPEELGKFTQSELARMKRIVELSGAKPD